MTSPVAAPGDTNPSDATEDSSVFRCAVCSFLVKLLVYYDYERGRPRTEWQGIRPRRVPEPQIYTLNTAYKWTESTAESGSTISPALWYKLLY